jgi:hypothetical protein
MDLNVRHIGAQVKRAQQEIKFRADEVDGEAKRVAARESRIEKMDADTELRHNQSME